MVCYHQNMIRRTFGLTSFFSSRSLFTIRFSSLKTSQSLSLNLSEMNHPWIALIPFSFSSLASFYPSPTTHPFAPPLTSLIPSLLCGLTSFTAHHLLPCSLFQWKNKKNPHLNHHHDKVVVSLAMRIMQLTLNTCGGRPPLLQMKTKTNKNPLFWSKEESTQYYFHIVIYIFFL